MTAVRGLSWVAAMLAATLVLVGLCGVPGLLVWLGAVSLGACFPNRVCTVMAEFQPRAALRWTADAWRWLDRR